MFDILNICFKLTISSKQIFSYIEKSYIVIFTNLKLKFKMKYCYRVVLFCENRCNLLAYSTLCSWFFCPPNWRQCITSLCIVFGPLAPQPPLLRRQPVFQCSTIWYIFPINTFWTLSCVFFEQEPNCFVCHYEAGGVKRKTDYSLENKIYSHFRKINWVILHSC